MTQSNTQHHYDINKHHRLKNQPEQGHTKIWLVRNPNIQVSRGTWARTIFPIRQHQSRRQELPIT
jgi:hypothetical protein